ncbi:MAG: hypothetical protein ABIH34_00475 [Nanoarchaeota archaeon]
MRRLLPLLILIVLVAAGCPSNDNADTETSGAFIGGTRGLEIMFLSGAPPEQVFDEDFSFDVSVHLKNLGEWPVPKEDVTVTILGVDPVDFGKTPADFTKNSPDDLEAAEKDPQGNIIEGTVTNVEFDNLQYAHDVAGEVEFDFIAKTCYKYGTKVQAKICVLEDLVGRTGEEQFCDPNSDLAAENSGAPVHVTKAQESVMGNNKIALSLTLEQVGAGSIHELASGCDADRQNQDKVLVRVFDPGIGTFDCSQLDVEGDTQVGYVKLYEDERSVRCTIELDDENLNDYEKVLNVELEYDYKELRDTPVRVLHSS